MSVKPTLLKDIRRTAISNHQKHIGSGDYNRWSVLAPKDRTFSTGKRPLSNSNDNDLDPAPKAPRLDAGVVVTQLKNQESALKEVHTLLGEMDTLNSGENEDPRFTCITKIFRHMVKVQENFSSAIIDVINLPDTTPAPTNTSKGKSTPANNSAQARKSAPKPVPSAEDTDKKRLKQVLREAEKRTVLFNLNLGPVPTMNKESVSRKVTLALGTIAKAGKHDYNVQDAEEVIDDVLSCSKLEFLGKATRKFYNTRNPQDSRNDKFCTIPVRMDFKDKETRTQAEISLRKICKVSCSVPYPRKLRAMLDTMVKNGKTRFPNSFIRTKVNVDTLTLEAHAKTESGWVDLGLNCQIPTSVLDNSVQVPVPAEMPLSNSDIVPPLVDTNMEDTEDETFSLS
jgi:hypothetical protein